MSAGKLGDWLSHMLSIMLSSVRELSAHRDSPGGSCDASNAAISCRFASSLKDFTKSLDAACESCLKLQHKTCVTESHLQFSRRDGNVALLWGLAGRMCQCCSRSAVQSAVASDGVPTQDASVSAIPAQYGLLKLLPLLISQLTDFRYGLLLCGLSVQTPVGTWHVLPKGLLVAAVAVMNCIKLY